MKEIMVTVNNKTGLHARPAKLFVKEAGKYKSNIFVTRTDSGEEISAKGILGVMSLGAVKGTELIIRAEGEDEKEAIQGIEELFAHNLYEE